MQEEIEYVVKSAVKEVLSILYLRCREVFADHVYGGKVTFNSLFEMLAVVQPRRSCALRVLSILYLRCRGGRSGSPWLHNEAFNSLFEMPASGAEDSR